MVIFHSYVSLPEGKYCNVLYPPLIKHGISLGDFPIEPHMKRVNFNIFHGIAGMMGI